MPRTFVLVASLALAIPIAHAADTVASQASTFRVSRYVVDGPNPLTAAATDQALLPYLGPQAGIDGLQAAATALAAALESAGHGLYTVVLPPQEVGEAVHLTVVPRPVARVQVGEGASVTAVRRSLPALQEGQTPNLHALARAMQLANENPARQVAVRFSASSTPGALDAAIDVQSRSPWAAQIKLDNTGTDQPGQSRMSTSLTHADVFGLDHAATLSYTTSPEAWQAIKQYGLFYKVPVYTLAGGWQAYALRSSSNTGTVADNFTVSGSGRFAGLSYTQHLLAWGRWQPTLQLGVDDKAFGDATAFNGTPVGHNVRSRPLTLTLSAHTDAGPLRGGLSLAYSTNLSGGQLNDDASYAAVRSGATRSWALWRANADLAWQSPSGYSLAGRLALQQSDTPLIGGEQFGVGGQDSVRALETRQLMGDGGGQASAELWWPSLPQGLRLGGFVDAGWVQRQQPATGTPGHEQALAAGLGLRWQVDLPGWSGQQATLSLDFARLLNSTTATPTGHERAYLSLLLPL